MNDPEFLLHRPLIDFLTCYKCGRIIIVNDNRNMPEFLDSITKNIYTNSPYTICCQDCVQKIFDNKKPKPPKQVAPDEEERVTDILEYLQNENLYN